MTHRPVYAALCVHWDHHPVDAAQRYGSGTHPDQIRRYLRAVKPDVTQYHTIGCKGYVNYPSRIAPAVPGLIGDPLAAWSQACADENVPFGCYAASFACASPAPHPEWRCVSRAGVVSEQDYCPNSRWADDFFTPLLLEILERYHPVHFWLDGTWLPGSRDLYCYCEHCQERFKDEYRRALPKEPQPADWLDLQPFYEASLDRAVSHIARALKQRDPNVKLACNSLYYFKDLRPPAHDVDWLSWDVLNTPNLHRASFEATYLNTAGKPADVMVYENGIIRWHPELLRRPRTMAQFSTEAGTILAHGCRMNLWHDPQPDGGIAEDKDNAGQAVAAFVRERQDWCVDSDSLAEVAVLATRQDHCLEPRRQDRIVRAAHQLLQEAHIPCDVVREDTLLARLPQYRAVLLPEIGWMDLDTAQWLHQFVLDGGNVLLVAAPVSGEPAPWMEALLGSQAGIQTAPQPESTVESERITWRDRTVEVKPGSCRLTGSWQPVLCLQDGRPWLAKLTVGEGAVAAIAGQAMTDYADTHWPVLRDVVAGALRECIGPEPLVELEAAPGLEVVINRLGPDVYVHLVNLTPGASFGSETELFFDAVPVYRDLALTLRPPQPPTHVIAMPGETPLRFTLEGGAVKVVVPELTYHLGLRLIGAAADG